MSGDFLRKTTSLVACLAVCPLFLSPVRSEDVSDGFTQGPGGYYKRSDRSGPYSISPEGTAVLVGLPMPFVRSGDSLILPATVTPQQYLVTQPLLSKSYRGVNPCMSADVRIKSVAARSLPVVSEPATYQGMTIPEVQRVTSSTDVVSRVTGTPIIRSYVELLGSAQNPMSGQQRIISVMINAPPGSSVDLSSFVCPFELQYGNGG